MAATSQPERPETAAASAPPPVSGPPAAGRARRGNRPAIPAGGGRRGRRPSPADSARAARRPVALPTASRRPARRSLPRDRPPARQARLATDPPAIPSSRRGPVLLLPLPTRPSGSVAASADPSFDVAAARTVLAATLPAALVPRLVLVDELQGAGPAPRA